MRTRTSGFTLIELMVVITIISLLAAALLTPTTDALMFSNKAVDEANLRWHHLAMIRYEQKYGHPPRYGGHEFVLDPWARGVVEHTAQNRDRYFSAQIRGLDGHYLEVVQPADVKSLWKDARQTSSLDTHYAGRASGHKQSMHRGDAVLMATDNEGGNTYRDGTVIVLLGDGSVQQWNRDPDLAKFGYSVDADSDEVVVVGPASLHPELQKLAR